MGKSGNFQSVRRTASMTAQPESVAAAATIHPRKASGSPRFNNADTIIAASGKTARK
jgi:hypothetical protein